MLAALEPNNSLSPILIVDDLRQDLLLAERVLRQCKILNPIHLLGSGRECLDFFELNSVHDVRPGILFLDLMMKPLCGLAVLRRIRNHHAVKRTLIVMLSGVTDMKAIHEGYQLGAHTFLFKPLNSHDVLRLIAAMPKYLLSEKVKDGYIIHPAPDSGSSFFKKEDIDVGRWGHSDSNRLDSSESEPSAN
jgi:CheY-like chemotaxis protein